MKKSQRENNMETAKKENVKTDSMQKNEMQGEKEGEKKEEKKKKAAMPELKIARAHLRYLRMSPMKVRVMANLVKGMDVDKALTQLYFSKRAAKIPVMKLIESAVANAVNNFGLEKNNLYIQSFTVDGGPMLKRWRARAHGRANVIRKRTSHLEVILAQRAPLPKKQEKIPEHKEKKEEVKMVDAKDLKKMYKIDQLREGEEKKTEEQKKEMKGFRKKLFQRKTG